MIASADKTRENRCRRHADRLKLTMKKSRAKRWSVDNQQGYMIVNPYINTIIAGEKFNLDLDDVEKFLVEYEENLRS